MDVKNFSFVMIVFVDERMSDELLIVVSSVAWLIFANAEEDEHHQPGRT